MSLFEMFNQHRTNYMLNSYPEIAVRQSLLVELKSLLQNKADEFIDAVNQDFSGRAREETLFLEIFPAIKAIDYCLRNLKKWTKSTKRHVPWYLRPSQAYVQPQPLGVIGIIVPWNYPIFLSIVPLAYALAAGNQVMIKFSELTPKTSDLISHLLADSSLLNHSVTSSFGDVAYSKEFASLPFNHLLFTGSVHVGKQVMRAASENLTPVTLELGGKCPVIVSESATIRYFNRLFMGKFFNAGQTCVAPDYLLIPKNFSTVLEDSFISLLKHSYPESKNNNQYTRIINATHKERLNNLLEDAKEKGARIVGLKGTEFGEKVSPCLIFNVNSSMKLMQEEIFGPLLSVITYDSFNEAINFVNQRANPLALYYFGHNKKEINQLKFHTLSGALAINDTIMHIANDDLPFGGVGESGLGHYHGKEGFLTFSKLKPVFIQRAFSPVTWFYPPYGKLLEYFLRYFAGIKTRKPL